MSFKDIFAENKVIIIPVALVTVLISSFFLFGRPAHEEAKDDGKGKPTTVMWENLAELDFKNGTAPRKLLDLSGTRVRIPGFIVPLEDNKRKITEFLLVPYAQACIHTPAPPQNQIVYVQMEAGQGIENSPFPVWAEGILNIKERDHTYGKASFTLTGQKVERYKEER